MSRRDRLRHDRGRAEEELMRSTHAIDSAFIPASPERVFATLLAVDRYPLWWPAALRVRVVSPPPHGLASVVEIRALGNRFRCRITTVEPPSRLAVEYVAGLHRATARGHWSLRTEGPGRPIRSASYLTVLWRERCRTLWTLRPCTRVRCGACLAGWPRTLAKDDISA